MATTVNNVKVLSDNLTVFPCVSRDLSDGNKVLAAKLMSENNITNLIKTLADKPSFVISEKIENPMKFVIDGYYFEYTNFPTSSTIYGYIKRITSTGSSGLNDRIEGDDSGSGVFKGLVLTSTPPSGVPNYLTLCVNGQIPEESRAKFRGSSLKIDSIDCGELK